MLGGTFDPIHVGHLALARAAVDQIGLERLLLVPAGQPPHKPAGAVASGEDRLAMIRLAIAGDPRLAASRIELDRPGPSYTVDTVEALLETADWADGAGASDLIVVLSAESFAGLPSWHDPPRLLGIAQGRRRAPTGSSRRRPVAGSPSTCRAGRIGSLSWTGRTSRCPRRTSGRGSPQARSIEGLVPPPVAAYIEAHHLYRDQPNREDPT